MCAIVGVLGLDMCIVGLALDDSAALATLAHASAAASDPMARSNARHPCLPTAEIIVVSSVGFARARACAHVAGAHTAGDARKHERLSEARTPALSSCAGASRRLRPSDRQAKRRCPAAAGSGERGHACTQQAWRSRKRDHVRGTRQAHSTRQASQHALAWIAPEQQRQRQQPGRREQQSVGHAREGHERYRDSHDQRQPKRKAPTRAESRHARNIPRGPRACA